MSTKNNLKMSKRVSRQTKGFFCHGQGFTYVQIYSCFGAANKLKLKSNKI